MNKTENLENLQYIKLYSNLLTISNLNSNDKIILAYIISLNTDTSTCWASNDILSKKLGISKKTVQNSINKLIKLDYINKTIVHKKLKTYRLLAPTRKLLSMIDKELIEKPIRKREKKELLDYDWLNDRNNY